LTTSLAKEAIRRVKGSTMTTSTNKVMMRAERTPLFFKRLRSFLKTGYKTMARRMAHTIEERKGERIW
jgi:hypothetical protein